ncbi:MAG: hypothetical protein U1F42_03485 [Candidatus Competibacteraceae bacterium]
MNNVQSQVTTTEPLSQAEIEAFAADWYRKLDEHVPASEITPMVAEQGLEFVVPEATLRSREEFGQWCVGGGGHPGVFNLFFDEVHTLRRVVASGSADRPTVEVVVNWQARRWRPPAPRSEWIGFDAYQTWEMIRSPVSGRPVIVRYIVDELRPMPGSPRL